MKAAQVPIGTAGDTLFDALGLSVIQRLDAWSVGRVLLVSSARSGEGKSFVAAQLAQRVATLLDGPVALVDANVRNPAVHAKVHAKAQSSAPGGGFFDCLAARELLADRLCETGTSGLWALPTTTGAAQQQQQLFRNAAVQSVLDAFRQRFALTIIDGASLNGVGCLALQADGTLMVVDASRTRRDIVSGALDTPYVDRQRVLGVVLNRRPEYVPRWLYRILP